LSTVVTVQGLEKRFGNRIVLTGASFAVQERDRIGLIGANGAGKSTLLKMMVYGAGAIGGEDPALVPDAGIVTWRRGLVLEYVAQEPALDAAHTVKQALARADAADHELMTIAAALQLPPMDRVIGQLSIGERRRVALARALLGRPDVLALDEPTNHLDARTVEWLEHRLATFPGALLVVTHDRYFLDRVATRILEVDRGKVYGYDGDYAEFLMQQALRLSIEHEAEYQRAAFVRREIDWIRRGPQARTTKQKARIDRFDAAVAAAPTIDEKRGPAMTLQLPAGPRLGSTIVELAHVSRTLGGKQLFRDLSLVMKAGDRLGIVGPNGVGKTTLIKTILGVDPPDTGTVTRGANTRPAYFEQGRSELRDELTVLEEVGDGYDYVELPGGKIHVRTFLRMLAFPDSVADTKIGQLSGGERNRVQLARLLRRGGNLLVLDEPTNDLDLPTLGALEDGLLSFPGCALIVSHDRWFLDRVATGILAFEGDGEVTLYEGSYSFYVERRDARAKARAPEAAAAPVLARAKRASLPAPRKLSFKERQELGGIEDAIAAAEAAVAAQEAVLQDPGIFKARAPEVPALVAKLDDAKAAVERLFARWQELDAIAAAEKP
jgi:ATP-binding cassette subfamily F protein uup